MKQIKIKRLKEEFRILEHIYGNKNVIYSRLLEWVTINRFPLPKNYNQKYTNILVITPDYYGLGGTWEEVYIDPELRILHDGEYQKIPHYHESNFRIFNRYVKQGWKYLCIRDGSEYLIEFLKQISVFLNDPWRF